MSHNNNNATSTSAVIPPYDVIGVIDSDGNSSVYYTDTDYMNWTVMNEEEDGGDSEHVMEAYRMIVVVVVPVIIVLGTLGNVLSFIVMRRRLLRYVSTCFYKSILALVDTGESARSAVQTSQGPNIEMLTQLYCSSTIVSLTEG